MIRSEHQNTVCVNPVLLFCRLLYDENFGGVSSMSKDHFKTINGYSNLFFGWGGEDDDLFNRCV